MPPVCNNGHHNSKSYPITPPSMAQHREIPTRSSQCSHNISMCDVATPPSFTHVQLGQFHQSASMWVKFHSKGFLLFCLIVASDIQPMKLLSPVSSQSMVSRCVGNFLQCSVSISPVSTSNVCKRFRDILQWGSEMKT
eukprot:5218850-Amphidinium_carterae.1